MKNEDRVSNLGLHEDWRSLALLPLSQSHPEISFLYPAFSGRGQTWVVPMLDWNSEKPTLTGNMAYGDPHNRQVPEYLWKGSSLSFPHSEQTIYFSGVPCLRNTARKPRPHHPDPDRGLQLQTDQQSLFPVQWVKGYTTGCGQSSKHLPPSPILNEGLFGVRFPQGRGG